MKHNRKRLLATACIPLFIFAGSSASGVEVFKWAGSDGVTHYAEAPPESAMAGLEILNVVAEPASPVVADYQSVLDVANSIEASRLERERARFERQKLLLQEQQQQQLAQQQNLESRARTYGYYLPYGRYRHHHKPSPHDYGGHPVNNGGQPHRGGAPGRVNLSH